MKISEILDYIKAYMELGYTKKQIIDILTKKGASIKEIDLCLKTLGVYNVEDLASTEYLFNSLLIALIDDGWKDVTNSMTPLYQITKWNFIGYKLHKGHEWYLIVKRTGEFNDKSINNLAIASSLISKKISAPRSHFLLFFISDGVTYLALKRFVEMSDIINYTDPLHGIGRTYLVDMTLRKCYGSEFLFPPSQAEFAARVKYLFESELRLDIDLFKREKYAKQRKRIKTFTILSVFVTVAVLLFIAMLIFF